MAYANAGAEEKAKAIRAGEHQEKVKALESEAKVADRSGDFARAIRVYRQLQELEPEDEGYRQMELGAEREMLRRRVHRALVSGYDEAALEDLERLAELDKRGAWKSLLHHVRLRSTMARARAYHELGEDEKIDELVTNLRSMGYSAVETEAVEAERTKGEGRVKLREAAERLIAGDVRNARRLTAEALSKDPGDRRLTRDAATLLQYSTGVRSELARRPFLSIFRIIPLLVACFAICLLGTRASGSLGNLDIATFLLGGLLLIVTKTAVLANGPTTLIYAIFVFSTLLLVGLWILLWLQEALQWLLWRGRNTSVPAANSEEEGRSRA
jgi:tetratricopeptide (TPR) repeat protein